MADIELSISDWKKIPMNPQLKIEKSSLMWTICDIMLKIENNMNQTQGESSWDVNGPIL